MPGLVGTGKFINCHFGNGTPFRYGTNATSIGLFTNCTLLGSYKTASDPPYYSAAPFVDSIIASTAHQLGINKTFLKTKIADFLSK
jgi:hypothetical protein